jgi:hypothetical protein
MNEDIKIKYIGNVYPSQGQNGDVFDPSGISPSLRSGQGLHGRGIGSCNAPKIIIYEEEQK